MQRNNENDTKNNANPEMLEALIVAVENGDVAYFKENVPAKFDVNTRDENRVPLIIHVANNNQIEMLRHLIDNQVNMNSVWDEGLWSSATATYLAANKGYLVCLQLLVENGAEFVMGKGSLKQTPLQTACILGQASCVEYLIGKLNKSQLNIQDGIDGWTAAHGAAASNHLDCLKLLKKAGADLNVTANVCPFETPLGVAKRRHCDETLAYLKKIGARDSMPALYSFSIYQVKPGPVKNVGDTTPTAKLNANRCMIS